MPDYPASDLGLLCLPMTLLQAPGKNGLTWILLYKHCQKRNALYKTFPDSIEQTNGKNNWKDLKEKTDK